MNIGTLIKHVIDRAVARIVGLVDVEKVQTEAAELAAEDMDYTKLMDELDMDYLTDRVKEGIEIDVDACDVAAEMDVGEVAEEFDPCDIAEQFDVEEVASHIDYTKLAGALSPLETLAAMGSGPKAESPAEEPDLDALSEGLVDKAVDKLLLLACKHIETEAAYAQNQEEVN